MKNISLIILTLFIGFSGISQVNVGYYYTYENNDTAYSFNVTGQNLDTEMLKLQSILGEPVSETSNLIVWEELNIPGLGEHITLKLNDGLLTEKKKSSRFVPFKEGNKEDQIKAMKDNQFRYFGLEFYQKDNTNVVTTSELKKVAQEFIEEVIK